MSRGTTAKSRKTATGNADSKHGIHFPIHARLTTSCSHCPYRDKQRKHGVTMILMFINQKIKRRDKNRIKEAAKTRWRSQLRTCKAACFFKLLSSCIYVDLAFMQLDSFLPCSVRNWTPINCTYSRLWCIRKFSLLLFLMKCRKLQQIWWICL